VSNLFHFGLLEIIDRWRGRPRLALTGKDYPRAGGSFCAVADSSDVWDFADGRKTGAHAPLRHADEHRSPTPPDANGKLQHVRRVRGDRPATKLGTADGEISARRKRRDGWAEAQLAEARRVAFARHELKNLAPWVDEAPDQPTRQAMRSTCTPWRVQPMCDPLSVAKAAV